MYFANSGSLGTEGVFEFPAEPPKPCGDSEYSNGGNIPVNNFNGAPHKPGIKYIHTKKDVIATNNRPTETYFTSLS